MTDHGRNQRRTPRAGRVRQAVRRSCPLLAGALMLSVALGGVGLATEDPLTSGDPFTSFEGVTAGDLSGDFRWQNTTVNPGGVGQVLIGPYYDVRPLVGPNSAVQAQQTQIKIVNVASGANAGVLFRLRFRDSKYGVTLLGVAGIVGCGQTWSATVFARPDGTPAVRSTSQTLSSFLVGDASQSGVIESTKGLNFPNGVPLSANPPAPFALADMQRGYFDVYPELAVTCAPNQVSAQGVASWTYSPGPIAASPGHVLSGSATIVTSSGHRASYPLVAVARFRPTGDGAADFGGVTVSFGSFVGQDNRPTAADCEFLDADGMIQHGPACNRQLRLAIAKSRIYVPFDDDAGANARTRLILLQPDKSSACRLFSPFGPIVPGVPYSCSSGGERIGARVTGTAGPGNWKSLRLPRVLTVVSISKTDDPNADVAVKNIAAGAGTVEFALDRDRKSGEVHKETSLDSKAVSFLGAGFTGYKGLPVLALVLREWNSPLAPGEFEFDQPATRSDYINADG
jgi:hypothetical protein